MFKHISPAPWTAGSLTVWGYPNKYGRPLIANCTNKNVPIATQRANARLIAIAPQMFELIRQMVDNEEAMELVKFMEADNENSTDE